VKGYGLNNELMTVSLFDVTGRQINVLTQAKDINEATTLDLSPFPKGMYLLKIQSGSTTETIKIIHQ
jgi:hypothetical protein